MSRRGKSGVINNTISPIGLHTSSSNFPMSSPKTVHIIVEKSPTRPESLHGRNGEYSDYERGIPSASRASTPGPCNYPNQYETFAPNHHYNLSWILDERNTQTMSSGSKRGKQNNSESPTSISPPLQDTTSSRANLLEKEHLQRNQSTERSQRNKKKRQYFLMQWFDRCIDKELNNHKETSFGVLPQYDPLTTNIDKASLFKFSRGTLESKGGASTNPMETSFDLRKDSIS
ncbi:uncharacterized protein [Euwallacea similis]|uniref:uncharacterized protein n=1 Tax=Euwallacea similis TaxID=1736056 RepID=UPI00344E1B0F